MTRHSRIAIIGGGMLGSAVAYFLAQQQGLGGSVIVFEPDSTYARSSTARSAAALRQQFNIPVNIELSRFGYEFFAHANRYLSVDGNPIDLGFVERGYLMLASAEGVARLRRAFEVQRAHGVDVTLLAPAELAAHFPWLNVQGVDAGCLGRAGEGWFDPLKAVQALRRKVEALGVQYVSAQVRAIQVLGGRVVAVDLDDGTRIAVDTVVNAAGAKAAQVARMAGITIPIEARKRCAFIFRASRSLPNFPNLVDSTLHQGGVFVRAYGEHFMAVTSPDPADDQETFDFDVDERLFEQVIRPALARRVHEFQRIERVDAWAGHYEYNTFDQNALLGPHPDVHNFIFACGFSGHGVMHAPAAGRGIAELIATGAYQTIDLGPLGYERIRDRRPLDDPQASERSPVAPSVEQ
jgi:glycine/D-amino acid oxidase-like deaminating enzyme